MVKIMKPVARKVHEVKSPRHNRCIWLNGRYVPKPLTDVPLIGTTVTVVHRDDCEVDLLLPDGRMQTWVRDA